MKLSTRARYALQSMVAIANANKEDETVVSMDRVAAATQISKRYLEQLAIALRNASLLRSVSGRSGGYLLAEPAKDITIGRIIEAAIGPINVVDCILWPETCLKADTCECRLIYRLINRRITEILDEISLADLTDENWLKRQGLDSNLATALTEVTKDDVQKDIEKPRRC